VERVYLTAPVGVFSMAFIFVSIFLDMNPFIGIQMCSGLLPSFSARPDAAWLVASCRARGTWLGKWVVGRPPQRPASFCCCPLSCRSACRLARCRSHSAAGGMLYSPGFSWWLQSRLRDVIFFFFSFAPRYFMEAAAVIVRLAGGTMGFRFPVVAMTRIHTPAGSASSN